MSVTFIYQPFYQMNKLIKNSVPITDCGYYYVDFTGFDWLYR